MRSRSRGRSYCRRKDIDLRSNRQQPDRQTAAAFKQKDILQVLGGRESLQEWPWPPITLAELRNRFRPEIQKLLQIPGNSSQPQTTATRQTNSYFRFSRRRHPTAVGFGKILNYQFLSLDGVSCGEHFMRAKPAHGYLLSQSFGELTLRIFTNKGQGACGRCVVREIQCGPENDPKRKGRSFPQDALPILPCQIKIGIHAIAHFTDAGC